VLGNNRIQYWPAPYFYGIGLPQKGYIDMPALEFKKNARDGPGAQQLPCVEQFIKFIEGNAW
jgi:hypothetical protein